MPWFDAMVHTWQITTDICVIIEVFILIPENWKGSYPNYDVGKKKVRNNCFVSSKHD